MARWRITVAEARKLPATITPRIYCRLVGVGQDEVYDALRHDDFPVPFFKSGKRYIIPTQPVLKMLDIEV
jgi:hypothetical protein